MDLNPGHSEAAEPMTPAAEAFAQMHEWYTGMREAGFTMTEACTIIASTMAQYGLGGQDNDSQS